MFMMLRSLKELNVVTKHSETLLNFFWRAVYILFKQGTVLLIFAISAKTLTVNEFGLYSFVMTVIISMTMLGDFGFSTAVSKFTAEYSLLPKEDLKKMLFSCLVVSFALCLLLAVLITLLVLLFKADYMSLFAFVLPLIFLIPMVSLFDGFYRGLKKFKSLGKFSIFAGGLAVPISLLLVHQLGMLGALLSQSLYYLIILIFFVINVKISISNFEPYLAKKILKSSLIIGSVSVGYFMFTGINSIILGLYGFFDELATFELINKLLVILVVPFAILAQVLAPNLTILNSKKSYSELYEKVIKYTVFSYSAAIVVGLFAYVSMPFIIETFFAEYHTNLFFELFPIILAIFVVDLTADRGIAVPIGYEGLMLRMYIFVAVLNLVTCLVAVNLFGYKGVMFVTFMFTLLVSIVLRIKILHKLRVLKKYYVPETV